MRFLSREFSSVADHLKCNSLRPLRFNGVFASTLPGPWPLQRQNSAVCGLYVSEEVENVVGTALLVDGHPGIAVKSRHELQHLRHSEHRHRRNYYRSTASLCLRIAESDFHSPQVILRVFLLAVTSCQEEHEGARSTGQNNGSDPALRHNSS